MKYDACIIGAGFGGLATAALLRSQGLSVCVLEKAAQPGGRARMTRREGFVLDWGMHVFRFAEQGPMQKVFDRLRVPVDWIPGHPPGHLILDGAMSLAPNGPKAFLQTDLFSPLEKLRIARVLAGLLTTRSDPWYGRSALERVNRFTSNERVRQAIGYSAFGIIAPWLDQTSCGELIDFLREGLRARRILSPIVGGAGQIIDKMTEIIGKKNLHLHCPVSRLVVSDKRIVKAETPKGDFEAKSFIHTVPIQQLFEVIDPALFPEPFVRSARDLEPTAGLSIDFALSDKVSEIAGGIIGLDPWVGGYFASNADPTLAPTGRQLATWFVLMDPASVGKKKERDRAEADLRKTIADHFPAFFDKVMWERKIVCPILDGVHLRVGQAHGDRVPIRNQTLDNLWFAGDTAGTPGCSSGIAFNSALEVADQIPRA